METNRSAKLSTRPSQAGRLSARTLIILALVALACGEALAQEPSAAQQQQRDEAPPPMRYMPDEVRRRIEATRDPKERARLGMEIAEERLTLAAQLAGEDRFEAATGEVGIYEAVVEDTIRFLHAGRVNNKLRDIFRHVEITLRSHVTRLESIRREMPERHAVYLKDAIEFVRDNRDQALGIFYDDTVIRAPRRPAVTSPTGERATTSVPAQAEAEKKPEQHR
jgi:hypothetical protein